MRYLALKVNLGGDMKIIVYSKPNCMQCEFTKRVLREANIDFEVRDVSVSEKALEEVRELNFK